MQYNSACINTSQNLKETATCLLISLKIYNIFNAVLRQKCRQIIATEFPELQDFIHMLYQDKGATFVHKDDGTWASIPVPEGFSQGYPASHLFTALVLNYILS